MRSAVSGRPVASVSPVSYTHLDVYKRQLQACLDRLPAKIGRVFMMRECLEREVEEICTELGITSNNCGVMLYRARMQLRDCLDRNWFATQR